MSLKTTTLILALLLAPLTAPAQLPKPMQEAKPGVRWWWLGSAVDKPNLEWSLGQYATHGIGAVEITPIYGVQGNEANDIPFLSPEWMDMLRFTEEQCHSKGIETDMATGTGWPFGGPWVPIEEAACKAIFVTDTVDSGTDISKLRFNIPEKERPYSTLTAVRTFPTGDQGQLRVIALFTGRTRQKVKRAAPGGEGYVIDHFDRKAVAHYLAHIDSAFEASGTPYPHTFFNDSYEVYGADWTPTLPDEFQKRRGYSLIDHLDRLVDGDPQTVSDYRETLGEILLENFTCQWTAWAHSHGAVTRNQAHGSPANLIDCYAAVDIPEIEGFGLTDFGIRGLRRDPSFTRPNFSDLSMLKYAPSAAHITGKRFTSSETFTWLTEHFRTSLSQMKPDMDLMFCAGVNHMFFHGTAYSPKDDPWPGWKFYATVDMSPTNTIWRDAPYLMDYIRRCQTYLQWGEPDNDFLVYLPVREMWRQDTGHLLMQFDIHSMSRKAPGFIREILAIDSLGYDCDYISDKYLKTCTTHPDGSITTAAGTTYKGLLHGADAAKMASLAKPEEMKTRLHLKMIRRRNPYGWHYFIANLTPHDVSADVALAVDAHDGIWYNPMDSTYSPTTWNKGRLHVSLRSGESRILIAGDTGRLLADSPVTLSPEPSWQHADSIDLTAGKWALTFTGEKPQVAGTFSLDRLQTWETLGDSAAVTMGTGVYETTFRLSRSQAARRWTIDLGDVRESARVYINGQFAGCAWAAPFTLDTRNLLRKGNNTLRIEVTNLPANRIADMDRRGVKWRKMKEINVVDLNYKKTTYAGWAPVKSGLNSSVKLYTSNN